MVGEGSVSEALHVGPTPTGDATEEDTGDEESGTDTEEHAEAPSEDHVCYFKIRSTHLRNFLRKTIVTDSFGDTAAFTMHRLDRPTDQTDRFLRLQCTDQTDRSDRPTDRFLIIQRRLNLVGPVERTRPVLSTKFNHR